MSFLGTLTKIRFEMNGREYDLRSRLIDPSGKEIPRLVIPSKLANWETVSLLKICIAGIRAFTSRYELWIIDNNSPEEYLEWLMDYPDINLVFNRTAAPTPGSFENGLALEIAADLVGQDTMYFMSLHQDTIAVKRGWIDYLLSKFSDQVRAAGVREDRGRVEEGVLHVLGYVIDFQLFKRLGLSFMPELPTFDVGDKAIADLKAAGYDTFAARNSLWDPEVLNLLEDGSPFLDINVDRSFDDEGDVFFMHLGRGVLKSVGQYEGEGKTNTQLWKEFIYRYIL